jgi:hypothetical protein
MTIISDAEFADFLTKFSLYYKLKAVANFENGENNYSNFLDFENKAFKFKCPTEKEIHTFRTKLWLERHHFYRRIYNEDEKDELPIYFDEKTRKLDITVHLRGICQSCQHSVDFLIKVVSDKCWEERASGISIYIQKIGQYPPYEFEPEASIQKYLTDEDASNYKKALTNLSVNYGDRSICIL